MPQPTFSSLYESNFFSNSNRDTSIVLDCSSVTAQRGSVLSLFPGIGLFDKAFEGEGFTVYRGPDLLFGGNIYDFHPQPGLFEGVIGGSPCQDFSRARRCEPTGDGVKMLGEFVRCVAAARPEWFVLENVVGVPDVEVKGYTIQRFNLDAKECGGRQRRLRRFQYGSLDGLPLVLTRQLFESDRTYEKTCLATEGSKRGRRTWADFCELQGLPRTFSLPGLSRSASYRAVGNGVPIYMGRVVAIAIRLRAVTAGESLCVCNCGRRVTGKQTHATPACRKRKQRERDSAAVTRPGPVTPA